MKNFPIVNPADNKEYWISRSIAVVTILVACNKFNEQCVLIVQRGTGTPDPEFVGKYCLPCGYLDYNETCVEAAVRELKEETGMTASQIRFNRTKFFEPSNTLMCNFTVYVDSDSELSTSKEIDSFNWFAFDDARKNIKPGSLAAEFLNAYLDEL
jgi:NAD+ diphosphatase